MERDIGWTEMRRAIKKGDVGKIETLLALGAPDATSVYNRNLFDYATWSNLRSVPCLVAHGLRTNGDYKPTCLLEALSGYYEFLSRACYALVGGGGYSDDDHDYGSKERFVLAEALIKGGVPVSHKKYRLPVLFAVCNVLDMEAVRFLVDRKVACSLDIDGVRHSAIEYVCRNAKAYTSDKFVQKACSLLTYLVEVAGADVNEACGDLFAPPLLTAAALGQLPLVETLLELGADPRATDKYSFNALHCATNNDPANAVPIIRLLFRKGTPLSQVGKCKDGTLLTPWQQAERRGDPAIAAALQECLAASSEGIVANDSTDFKGDRGNGNTEIDSNCEKRDARTAEEMH